MNFTQRRLLKQYPLSTWPEWANFIAVDGHSVLTHCYSDKPIIAGSKDVDGFWFTESGLFSTMGFFESENSVDWTESLVTREQAQAHTV